VLEAQQNPTGLATAPSADAAAILLNVVLRLMHFQIGTLLLACGNVKQNRAMLLRLHLIGSAQALNALVAAWEKQITMVKRQL